MASSNVYVVTNGSHIDSIYADIAGAKARCDEANEEEGDGYETQTHALTGGTVSITSPAAAKTTTIVKRAKTTSAEPKPKPAMKKTDTPAEQRAANAAKSKKSDGSEELPENIKALLAGSGNQLSGLKLVVTGVPPTMGRKNAETLVTAYGGKLLKSLSKQTDYVVVGDDAGPKKYGSHVSIILNTDSYFLYTDQSTLD